MPEALEAPRMNRYARLSGQSLLESVFTPASLGPDAYTFYILQCRSQGVRALLSVEVQSFLYFVFTQKSQKQNV